MCFTGSLVLRQFNAKHRQNVSTKTIEWGSTSYGGLLALSFNNTGSRLAAVSSKHVYILPFLSYMVSILLCQLFVWNIHCDSHYTNNYGLSDNGNSMREAVFVVACFTCTPDSIELVKLVNRLLSGETLLQAKNFTGYRWDSNPGPCR